MARERIVQFLVPVAPMLLAAVATAAAAVAAKSLLPVLILVSPPIVVPFALWRVRALMRPSPPAGARASGATDLRQFLAEQSWVNSARHPRGVLEVATRSFETVSLERDRLREQLEALRAELERSPERFIDRTAAQRAAEDAAAEVRRAASDEVRGLVDDACRRAEDIVREAEAERRNLDDEIERLEAIATVIRGRYRAFLGDVVRFFEREAPGRTGDEPISAVLIESVRRAKRGP